MTELDDYIYSERQCRLLEGPFSYTRSKWYHSLEKRVNSLRWLFYRPRARLRERIVEYPLVLAALSLLPPRSRIADLGGASSLLPLQMIYLGHEVHLLDLRPCPLQHPQLHAHRLDIFDNNLQNDHFHAVSCISVVEHVGIERYGGKARPDGDFALMNEIKRLTHPSGLVVISAPYGCGHDPATNGPPLGYRIYNRNRLQKLLEGFEVESLRFFVMEKGCWLEKDQTSADKVPTSRPISAIFFAQLRLPK